MDDFSKKDEAMRTKRMGKSFGGWMWIAVSAFLTGLSASAAAAGEKAEPLTLASKGVSTYTIVVSPRADDVEKFAAGELRTYLKKVSGATLPIRDDSNIGPGPVHL